MTEQTSNQTTPEKPKSKKTFWVILIIAVLFSVDHYRFHYLSGSESCVADSTKVETTVAPVVKESATVDTAKSVVKSDTSKSK